MKTAEEILNEIKRQRYMLIDAIWCEPACYSTDELSAKVNILDELIYFIESDK